jgi:hypothetical protein
LGPRWLLRLRLSVSLGGQFPLLHWCLALCGCALLRSRARHDLPVLVEVDVPLAQKVFCIGCCFPPFVETDIAAGKWHQGVPFISEVICGHGWWRSVVVQSLHTEISAPETMSPLPSLICRKFMNTSVLMLRSPHGSTKYFDGSIFRHRVETNFEQHRNDRYGKYFNHREMKK